MAQARPSSSQRSEAGSGAPPGRSELCARIGVGRRREQGSVPPLTAGLLSKDDPPLPPSSATTAAVAASLLPSVSFSLPPRRMHRGEAMSTGDPRRPAFFALSSLEFVLLTSLPHRASLSLPCGSAALRSKVTRSSEAAKRSKGGHEWLDRVGPVPHWRLPCLRCVLRLCRKWKGMPTSRSPPSTLVQAFVCQIRTGGM